MIRKDMNLLKQILITPPEEKDNKLSYEDTVDENMTEFDINHLWRNFFSLQGEGVSKDDKSIRFFLVILVSDINKKL